MRKKTHFLKKARKKETSFTEGTSQEFTLYKVLNHSTGRVEQPNRLEHEGTGEYNDNIICAQRDEINHMID